jgi:hypothetical protein
MAPALPSGAGAPFCFENFWLLSFYGKLGLSKGQRHAAAALTRGESCQPHKNPQYSKIKFGERKACGFPDLASEGGAGKLDRKQQVFAADRASAC